jgi:stalled ribosome alternative rescue factor ArfA
MACTHVIEAFVDGSLYRDRIEQYMACKGYERTYFRAHQKMGNKTWKWLDGYTQRCKNETIHKLILDDAIKMFKSFPCIIAEQLPQPVLLFERL